MKPPFDLAKFNSRLPPTIKRGFVDRARRVATPYFVHQRGLCEDHLGQRRYCEERETRRLWIEDYCVGQHEIEPIRDTRMWLSGLVYRFSNEEEAFAFRMRF